MCEPGEHTDEPRRRLWSQRSTARVRIATPVDRVAPMRTLVPRVREVEGERTASLATHDLHPAQLGVDARLGGPVAVEARRDLDDPVAVATQHIREREELGGTGERPRDESTVGHAVAQRAGGRPAQRAGRECLVEERTHPPELVVVGIGTLVEAAVAHRVVAQRGVPDHPSDVHPEWCAREPTEVVPVGLPVPGQPVEDAPSWDVLDRFHHLREIGVVGRLHRRERHSAVADDDRRDAVPARRRTDGIPRELGIEVRVHVDEPRRDIAAGGVDLAATPCVDDANLDDAIAVHRYVGRDGRCAGAVDHGAVADDEVVRHATTVPSRRARLVDEGADGRRARRRWLRSDGSSDCGGRTAAGRALRAVERALQSEGRRCPRSRSSSASTTTWSSHRTSGSDGSPSASVTAPAHRAEGDRRHASRRRRHVRARVRR